MQMLRNLSLRTRALEERAPHRPPVHVPGLLQIKIKDDVVQGQPDLRGMSPAAMRALRLPTQVEAPFTILRQKKAIKAVIPLFSRATRGRPLSVAPTAVAAAFMTSVRDADNEDLRGINMLKLSSSANLDQIERDLQNTAGVEYVHRVPTRWTCAVRPSSVPADPLVNRQWGLRAIRYFSLGAMPDASMVKVAVLDTGLDTKHPDLQHFATYTHEGASAEDIVGHGTHVAGIIAATSNNGVGITGMCRCALHVWKIFGDDEAPDGEYYVDEVMYQRALNAARTAGMRVLNLSIGGTLYTQTEALLIRRLIDAGCTVVAAMGNEYLAGNPIEYPAAYPGVMAVGAINEANRRAYFSNTGPHITLTAPGEHILSTVPMKASAYRHETQYAAWSGTSMATPHVTAAVALLLAKHPAYGPATVAKRLQHTATKLSAMKNRTTTKEYGFGLLNLQAAVA
jgi:subtilisin family serine protease